MEVHTIDRSTFVLHYKEFDSGGDCDLSNTNFFFRNFGPAECSQKH